MHLLSCMYTFFLRIVLYVVKLVQIAKYSNVSGLVILIVLYNMSLYRMDLSRPDVIQLCLLCIFLFNCYIWHIFIFYTFNYSM